MRPVNVYEVDLFLEHFLFLIVAQLLLLYLFKHVEISGKFSYFNIWTVKLGTWLRPELASRVNQRPQERKENTLMEIGTAAATYGDYVI